MYETWAMTQRGREGGSNLEMQRELAYAIRGEGRYGGERQFIMCEAWAWTTKVLDRVKDAGNIQLHTTAPNLLADTGEQGNMLPRVLISSTEGSPAKTYPWPESGPVLGESAAVSGMSSSGCCPSCGHDGSSLRMFPDSYIAPQTLLDATSPSSSTPWQNSGSMVSRGRFWTRSTSESRNAAGACSLSAVLQERVSKRYFLSAKAAAGILIRAHRRAKALPPVLWDSLAALVLTDATETARVRAAGVQI